MHPIIFFWFCGPWEKKDLKISVCIHFVQIAYLDRMKLGEHCDKNFKYHFSKKNIYLSQDKEEKKVKNLEE